MEPEIGKVYVLRSLEGKSVRYERFDDDSAYISGDEEWIFEKGAWKKAWEYLLNHHYVLDKGPDEA